MTDQHDKIHIRKPAQVHTPGLQQILVRAQAKKTVYLNFKNLNKLRKLMTFLRKVKPYRL